MNIGESAAMGEERFWSIIEQSRRHAVDSQVMQIVQLDRALSHLSRDELVSFYDRYQAKKDEAYHWDIWAAAYIINGGCSDDCFDYFRAWLIAQGELTYTDALKDPESLVGKAVPFETGFEEFDYVAWDVFARRFGDEIPHESAHPSIQGEDWDEESVDLKYPKLAAWINAS